MHDDLQKYLDGDLPRSALSAEALAERAEWETLEGMVAQRRAERAPAGLINDVMNALPPVRVAAWRRALSWLVTPRPIRMAPWMPVGAFAAAALAFAMLRPDSPSAPLPPVAGAPQAVQVAAKSAAPVYVQFAFTARGAQSVSVAGDFNGWSLDASALRDPDGDGVWAGMVPLTPGVHKYMFIVNGDRWVTDPRAEGYADDGFGMRNAVIGVPLPPGRTI